jgi:peptide/nickel transport system ATP-binding protein
LLECVLQHETIPKQEAYQKAQDMLALTGVPRVEKMMKEYPFQLSGGQRQRVMIAMALVCKPKILIADEPTTALDVTIQAQILDLMNNLKKEIGTSIIFITHDLGVVAEVCDYVAVMYCGRIVEKGDVYSIFANTVHPYTKGLLASIPKLGDHSVELTTIPGNVPNPKYMPKGCKFAPRCAYAFDKCQEEEPDFYDLGNGHLCKCWLCEKKGGAS